jgi:hypothetical protein
VHGEPFSNMPSEFEKVKLGVLFSGCDFFFFGKKIAPSSFLNKNFI